MQIGVFSAFANPITTPAYLSVLGPACEERGFHSLWAAEHVVLFDEYTSQYPYAEDGRIPAGGENGFLEPFNSLSFLAAHTERIRLGTGICLLPQRNPVYTAKEVSTVDWLSGGRVDLGIGVGWLAEEFQALGVPFERRGARCRAYLEVMRRLWCNPISEYHGEFYDLPACRQFPKPVQSPHPPLHFGGESDAALRRVARMGQGWFGFGLAPDAAAERIAALEKLLEAQGGKRSDVDVVVSPYLRPTTSDDVARYHAAGVDQLVVLGAASDAEGLPATLDRLAKDYLEPAKSL